MVIIAKIKMIYGIDAICFVCPTSGGTLPLLYGSMLLDRVQSDWRQLIALDVKVGIHQMIPSILMFTISFVIN